MTEDNPLVTSRRSVLRKGALATGLAVGGVAVSGTAAAGIGEGRVGHYTLNNIRSNGTVLDASPENNDGTNHGATVARGDGQVGNALEFDGDDYVDVADDESLDLVGKALTVAAWFKTTSSSRGGLVRKNDKDGWGPAYDLEVNRATGKVDFLLRPPKTVLRSAGGFNDGEWHHAAGTFDPLTNEMKLYVDGEEEDSETPSIQERDTTGALQIGRMAQATASTTNRSVAYFNGLIDEARVYDRALSKSEIQSLASMGGNSEKGGGNGNGNGGPP